MAKNTLKFGKFVKKRNPDKENQYIWSVKQTGKMTGVKSRELKAALDNAIGRYFDTDSQQT